MSKKTAEKKPKEKAEAKTPSTEIRSISNEALAKAAESNKILQGTKRSLLTETVSNGFFLGAVYTFGLPDAKHAIIGAMAVYAPLAYEGIPAWLKKRKLKNKNRIYLDTKDASTFDDVGLTVRGSRPIVDEEEHEPFITWSQVVDPIKITPKNQWGIFGSGVSYARNTTQDLTTLATKTRKRLKDIFSDKTSIVSNNFIYTQDPCNKNPTKIIREKLSDINNDATVQMPAAEARLKTCYLHTRRSIFQDYGKIGANAVGILGAGEFCLVVGRDIVPNVTLALQGTDPLQHSSIAATWLAACLVGTGPLKHFLDDAAKVHSRLQEKWALASTEMKALASVTRARQNIEETHAELTNKVTNWDEGLKDAAIESLKYNVEKIDTSSLSYSVQEFLMEKEIIPTPPASNMALSAP